jgi:hypothetical protein
LQRSGFLRLRRKFQWIMIAMAYVNAQTSATEGKMVDGIH